MDIQVATIRFIQSGGIQTILADTREHLIEIVTALLAEIADTIADGAEVPKGFHELNDFCWQREELELELTVVPLHITALDNL
tara:strand:- start:223 stop:471 length:249 start_codon:yes stop_codon:yes gene_type:complete